MNPKYQNLIDSYLRNELSQEELSSFESLMESDPAFREEVHFEQHVNAGIARYRKAELKARLDAIEVSPVGFGIGQMSSTLTKAVGGLVTAGIIGAAGYFLLNTGETDVNASKVAAVEVMPAEYPQQKVLPEVVIGELEEEEVPTANMPNEEVSEVIASEITEPEIPTETSAESGNAEVAEEEFMPQVNVPGLNEIESEEAFVSANLEIPEVSSSDKINTGVAPLDVKSVNRRAEGIKYKYFDGKLYLYGDFKKQPYEILEINSASERKIYVYHNDHYFVVSVTDEVKDLPVITNEKLIRELEILRNNKLTE